MHTFELSDKQMEDLRLEGIYSEPTFADTDVELYETFHRVDVPFGGYKRWDPPQLNGHKLPTLPKSITSVTDGRPYFTRLGGFCRKNLMDPDQTGQTLAQNGINFVDSFVGYDPTEAIMICRKYGIQPYFYLPDCPSYLPGYVGVTLPFTKKEIEEYRKAYSQEMATYVDWVQRLGSMYDFDFVNCDNQIWILYVGIDMMPNNLFEEAMRRCPQDVAREFRFEHGFDLPVHDKPTTPIEQSRRIKFWRWVRRRFDDVYRVRAEVVRQHLPKGVVMTNFHWTTQLDTMMHGQTMDVVGINTRPMMLDPDNEIGRRYETGYAMRLWADLTQKPVMAAPRANLLGVSPGRLVAGEKAIKYYYNQCIQNGAWGFYIFFQDFSSGRQEYGDDFVQLRESLLGLAQTKQTQYCGAGCGNPDSSTLPQERWQTLLDCSKKVAHATRFTPPQSETGIYVPIDSCSMGDEGWKRVFSAYVELTKAGVWASFVSSDQVMAGKVDLGRFKLLFVPFASFENQEAAEALGKYVEDGGVLVCGDPRTFSFDTDGNDLSAWRKKLFGVDKITQRRADNNAVHINEYDSTMRPYGPSWGLTLDAEDVETLAAWEDGQTAVSRRRLGKGQAILFGCPIMDCYEYLRQPEQSEDEGRSRFYKAIEKQLGITDHSWIWDVTIDNVAQIAGHHAYKPAQPDETIAFRDFLLQHKR